MRRRRISKAQRGQLRVNWKPVVFPIALLIYGPPPRREGYSNLEDWHDASEKYGSTVRSWYEANYLSKYNSPRQPIKNLLLSFYDQYLVWTGISNVL